MFYIVDNKKTVQVIEKIEKGLKVYYTDGTSEEIELSIGSSAGGNSGGGSSIKVIDNLDSKSPTDALSANQGYLLGKRIPPQFVKNVTVDEMNNGLGIWYSDGKYHRLMLEKIPMVGRAFSTFRPMPDGEIRIGSLGGKEIKVKLPYTMDVDLDTSKGLLKVKKGNEDLVKEINLKEYIEQLISEPKTVDTSDIEFTKYYNKGEEISEDEFKRLSTSIKYYNNVEGELIEVDEEEYFNFKDRE